jgi:3'-5' exonuclease
MMNRVSAPGLECRNYFHRYSDSHIDLCDLLSSFSSQRKLTLEALCCALDIPGKPDGMDGSKVAEYGASGRLAEVAGYCESDVIATYRIWLRYQLFCGKLTRDAYEASEANLLSFITERALTKPHLSYLIEPTIPTSPQRVPAHSLPTVSSFVPNENVNVHLMKHDG